MVHGSGRRWDSPDRVPKRNVAFLLPSPSPHQVDFFNALTRCGLGLHLCFTNARNRQRNWGAPIPDAKWSMLPAAVPSILTRSISKHIDTIPMSVWVLGVPYTSIAGHAVRKVLARKEVPYVVFAEPQRPRSGRIATIRHWVQGKLIRGSSGLLTTGRKAVDIYSRRYPCVQVRNLPYFINQTEPGRRASSASGSAVRFVTSSQLIERKGLDVLFSACRLLPDTGWKLRIYGSGPLEAVLLSEAEAFGGKIELMGTLEYERRFEAYAGADVFVFPTRWDGWGMVLPEAMMSGLPVVSTNMAMSAHEFVRDGENGFLGPAESPEFLCGAMKAYIDNPRLIREHSRESTAAMEEYTPDAGARAFCSYIEELLGDHD